MWRRLRNLLERRRLDDDLRDEMAFHLGALEEEGRDAGLTDAEARRAARRRFGNRLQIRESTRRTWGVSIAESTAQDLRYAARVLAKHPLATCIAVGSLAVGIGMATAILTILNGVLLRPPPLYVDGDRLVQVGEAAADSTRWNRAVPAAVYEAWRSAGLDAGFAASRPQSSVAVRLGAYPESIRSQEISPELLPLLGVRPALGRNFEEAEAFPGRPRAVLISHSLWERRFEQAPGVLGRRLWIGGEDATVVGVMPERFWFGDPGISMWLPLRLGSIDPSDSRAQLEVIARHGEGLAPEGLQAALQTVLQSAELAFGEQDRGRQVVQVPLNGLHLFASQAAPALRLLVGAIGLAMIIVCVNVGNIMTARWTARQKEGAVRAALGAGRLRLVRQFLAESALIAALGGVGALVIAYWGVQVILAFAPAGAVFYDFAIDARMLAFAFGIIAFTGLGAGLLPALFDVRANLQDELKQGSARSSSMAPKQRLRGSLVIAEIAATVTLLVAVGSMVGAYAHLDGLDPGFEAKNLLSFRLDLPAEGFHGDGRAQFERYETAQRRIIEQLDRIPGVVRTAAAYGRPPLEASWQRRLARTEAPLQVGFHPVSAEYFETVGIGLERGRLFGSRDAHDSPWTVVVNQTMARRLWPDTDPLGQTIQFAEEGERPREVIGVVADVANFGILRETVACAYAPFTQRSALAPDADAERIPSYFLVRTSVEPAELTEAIRREITKLYPGEAIERVMTVAAWMDQAAEEMVAGIFLLAPLVGFALILSAIGIYGVLAYATARRTHEIGVRMALGADRREVLSAVLGQGLRLAGWGLMIGAAGSYALSKLVGSQVEVLRGADAGVFGGAVGLAFAAAAVASYFPARRATRIHPVEALRYE